MGLSGYNNVLLYLLNKLIMFLYTWRCIFLKKIDNIEPEHLKLIQMHLKMCTKTLPLHPFLENGICI